MQKRVRPQWPILVHSRDTEIEVDPRLTPLTLALLDAVGTGGEARGYDPYDTSAKGKPDFAWDSARSRR